MLLLPIFLSATPLLGAVARGRGLRYAGLFNPENIFIAKEGGGAGNNWARGYAHAEQVRLPGVQLRAVTPNLQRMPTYSARRGRILERSCTVHCCLTALLHCTTTSNTL